MNDRYWPMLGLLVGGATLIWGMEGVKKRKKYNSGMNLMYSVGQIGIGGFILVISILNLIGIID